MPLSERNNGAFAVESAGELLATEPLPSNAKVVRLGPKRLVLSSPNQHQFGHFGIEMFYALAYARLIRAPVVFLRSRSLRVGHTLLAIDTDEVRILRSRTMRLIGRAAWVLSERLGALRRWPRGFAERLRETASLELRRYITRHPDISKDVRSQLMAKRKELRQRPAAAKAPAARPSYNRRRLASNPLRTTLVPDAQAKAEELAASFGIGPETRLVCLHVRERGYKLGDEMQDKADDAWDDSVRNGRIETHFPAIDFLVERGYTVFRMGDPTMTPVDRPGVIDHATASGRDPLLELYCMLRSRFIICGESGPYSVSFLTNTPLLSVNSTDPIGAFPIRPDGIYLLKTVIDRSSGEEVWGARHLTAKRLEALRDPTTFEFRENTPEQILDAVAEMLDLLDHETPESPGQRWFREIVTSAAETYYHLAYVRKHGPDRGYMGYGRLARSQAEDWYERSRTVKTESAEEREKALA